MAFKPCNGSSIITNHSNLHETFLSKPDVPLISNLFSSYESKSENSKIMLSPFSKTDSVSNLNLSQSQGNLSQCSVSPLQNERWFLESPVLKHGSVSPDLSCIQDFKKSASLETSTFHAQTPSPSDSGVVELEAMLREKDSEINYLRETMEKNEQVIFKVYEEKGQTWEKEYKKLRLEYEESLKNYYLKLSEAEQSIAIQKQQKELEKKTWDTEFEQLKKREDSLKTENNKLKNELAEIKALLENTQWSLWEKKGESALLKSQLKNSIADQNFKASELASLKTQLKDYKTKFENLDEKNKKLQDNFKSIEEKHTNEMDNVKNQLSDTLNKLQFKTNLIEKIKKEKKDLEYDLDNIKEKLNLIEKGFDKEREQWKEEKDRVLKYQKQLEINYKKMFQTNKFLENEFNNLTLILKSHCYSDLNQSPC